MQERFVNVKKYFRRCSRYYKDAYIDSLEKSFRKRMWIGMDILRKNIGILFKICTYQYIYIDYAEIMVTTKCTLCCKDCAVFMPYFRGKGKHTNIDENINTLQALTRGIDELGILRILGGEPFLYPHLLQILEYSVNNKKIDMIQIVTNGTMLPKEELLNIMKNRKVSVYISNYGELSCMQDKLCNLLRQKEIQYKVSSEGDLQWTDFGTVEKRNAKDYQLRKQFSRCKVKCNTMLNGQIFRCARSAAGKELGIIPAQEGKEFLNLSDDTKAKNLRNQLKDFLLKKKYVETCDHCLMATKQAAKIPMAVQYSEPFLKTSEET